MSGAADAAVMEVENLGIAFGGVLALQNVSFAVPPDRIVGVMGPNGAGKTTLFNLITGVYPPSWGKIRFGGRELQGMKPSRICQAGIGRTFQSGRPFVNITAFDNVMVGLYYGARHAGVSDRERRHRAEEILAFVGMAGKGERPVSSLNLIERKMVELARVLATGPRVVLLDELLAGVNPFDLEPAIRTICRIRDELGITVVWIEHIMKVLMDTCEHLIVLHHGEKLAEGTPQEIAADAVVAEAYFGKKYAARHA
jgi:branched-chain amino acid transport system ATP-binding protein